MSKTHWKKLHNPDYLGAYSIENETLTVQIQSVAKQQIVGADGKKDEAIVATLVNQKPLILNVTNCKTIARLYGAYIEDWQGKFITLYIDYVKAFGQTNVEALRVKPEVPKPAGKPELTPTHEKWNGAKEAIKNGKATIEAIKKAYSITPENEAILCDNSK